MTVEFQRRKLIEVCKLINGRAYSKPELLAEGKYPVLRVGNFFTNDHWYYSDLELDADKYCDKGDLLYAWSASFGPRIWHADKVIYHYHIWKVIPDLALIDKKFLFYFFEWDADQIKKDQGAGTTMVHVSKGSMENREINLPALKDQARIVTLLDEAFADIATAKAHAEKNLQNARALFISHLQSGYQQQGEGWTTSRIADIAKHSLGKMLDKSKNRGDLKPYLRNLNVRWFDFDLSDVQEMKFTPEESGKYTAIKGDVLICEGGYPGRCAIWEDDEPIYFQKALHRVRFHNPLHSKWFVNYLYLMDQTGDLKNHFSGTGIQHFTGEALAKFTLPIPPYKQMQQVLGKANQLEAEVVRLESVYRQKLTALDDLKKSLLHQPFSGQL
jgi:type I restriction enzyme S subunit